MSHQRVKHELNEQKEPEGLASRPRQAGEPAGSSPQLMEIEPDSELRLVCSVPEQGPGQGVGSREPTGAGR